MTTSRQLLPLLVGLAICLTFVSRTESAPMVKYDDPAYELEENPEEALLYLLARVERTLLKAREDPGFSKRIVDFGLGRGYSGMQEAKHRMGMAAANFAGGPGRRRRSIDLS